MIFGPKSYAKYLFTYSETIIFRLKFQLQGKIESSVLLDFLNLKRIVYSAQCSLQKEGSIFLTANKDFL